MGIIFSRVSDCEGTRGLLCFKSVLCIHSSFVSVDSTNNSPCSTTAFTTEKTPHVRGPGQLMFVLFKGQLDTAASLVPRTVTGN